MFEIPPQPGYVYDAERNQTLVFDGITKIQHSLTLKVEDVPDNKKGKNYVNNAQNEPDEVTFDVLMSNVYTTLNDLTRGNADRCKAAYDALIELKKARRKVQVITYLGTYQNMLLKSIAIVQDDAVHYGFQGTLTFREAVESKGSGGSASGTRTSSSSATGVSESRTPSIWVSWVGSNAI